MKSNLRNITDIPTELIHNNTTLRKRLVSTDEHHTGDIATMNYAWLEPKKQLDIHTHIDGEEFYFFLEGTGQMLVGEEWLPVTKDDFVIVPAATNHSVKNNTDKNLVFLTIRTQQATNNTDIMNIVP